MISNQYLISDHYLPPPQESLGDSAKIHEDHLMAQEAVVGSMLLDSQVIGEVLEYLREEDFLSARCRLLFRTIKDLFANGEKVDPVTVLGRLGAAGDSEMRSYVLQLMEVTPTSSNVMAYSKLVREQARRVRRKELGRLIHEEDDDEKAARYIAQLNELSVERRGVRRLSMEEALMNFADRHSAPHQYLTWGMSKLDQGMYIDPGDLVVLGGYPSAGKTALAVSFAYHHAEKMRVGFYSLETNQYKLADRLISNIARVELSRIKLGTMGEEDWESVAEESDRMRAHNLDLIDAAGMSVQDIRADALAHRYQAVYVDYLQLVEPESRREIRQEQVAGISRGLQRLAHGSGILVVALSQLSRQKREGADKVLEPTMADLRESGQVEQDADAVLLLYLERPQEPDTSRRILKIGKNKEGTRGRVFMVFDGKYQRFRQSELDEPADRPKTRRAAPERRDRQESFWNLPGSEIYMDQADADTRQVFE